MERENIINAVKSGVFLSLLNGGYKFILWLSRYLTGSEKISVLVAGFISGLSLAVERDNWREAISLIVLSRAVYVLLTKIDNSDLKMKIPGVSNSDIPIYLKLPYGEVLLTWLSVGFVIFAWGFHREVIAVSTYKLIFKFTLMKKNDFISKYLWRAKTDFIGDLQNHYAHCIGQKFCYPKGKELMPVLTCEKHKTNFKSIYSIIMKDWALSEK